MWFFYSIIFLYSIISSALGVGGISLLTFFTFYFDPKESVGLITIFFLYQNISKLLFFHKYICWDIGFKILIYCVPGAIIGSSLLQFIPSNVFEKILALFIIISVSNDLFHFFKGQKTQQKSIPLYGFGYGFSSGFLGNGNMLRGTLFLSLGLIKESFIATASFTAFCINIPKIITYSLTDIISIKTFLISIPLLFLSFGGTFIGKNFLNKVKDNVFFYIVNGFLLLSAIVLLLK